VTGRGRGCGRGCVQGRGVTWEGAWPQVTESRPGEGPPPEAAPLAAPPADAAGNCSPTPGARPGRGAISPSPARGPQGHRGARGLGGVRPPCPRAGRPFEAGPGVRGPGSRRPRESAAVCALRTRVGAQCASVRVRLGSPPGLPFAPHS
jgi:hypothetical protein